MPKRIPAIADEFIRVVHADGWDVENIAAFCPDVSLSTIRRIMREPKTTPVDAFDVRTVAALLGVSESKVYQLVRDGHLAAERHGRRISITKEALEQYRAEAAGPQITRTYRHLD